jgi:hypothetical protein
MNGSSGVGYNDLVDWERIWCPYDERTYQEVLAAIRPVDVVVDIGAGDFCLTKRMAEKAERVYGIEIQSSLIPKEASRENLFLVQGDAQTWPFPADVTIGVLLMRHCRHFTLYAEKLRHAGADRLVTNARWRMGVEVINLTRETKQYSDFELGWYACWCGSVGFKPGPAEHLTPATDAYIHEVIDCPVCQSTGE